MDIILFALARWDGPYSSTAFSLAKELAKTHRVFYVENPITLKYFVANFFRKHVWRRVGALFFGVSRFSFPEKQNDKLIAVIPSITIPINFLPEGIFYNFFAKVNDAILSRTMKSLSITYSVNNFIYFNCFNPFYFQRLSKGFSPKLFVYMTVDDIRHSTHIKKHGPRLEREIMQRADIVFATSLELTTLASKYAKHSYYLPNAADISLFKTSHQELPKPIELAGIDSQLVIYTGNIDHRIDFDLLNGVVKRSPNLTFILVGPVSINEQELQTLRSCSNVLFTGRKDLTQLPALLKFSHCAIIPFKCNTLTKSIYPLKINEYLAAGKPVIATPFSGDIQTFSSVITIADNPASFTEGINNQISNDSDRLISDRLAFVECNTWKARVDTFWEHVKNHLDKN